MRWLPSTSIAWFAKLAPCTQSSAGFRFGYRVHPAPQQALRYATCACCGQQLDAALPSTTPRFCSACWAHVARQKTRRLGVILASILIGCSSSLIVPLLWPAASAAVTVMITLAMAILPLLIDTLWLRKPTPPHTATDCAVFQRANDAWICTNRKLARYLLRADRNAKTTLHVARLPARHSPWGLCSGLLLGAPLALASHSFYHPPLRVLNLSNRELAISIDGVELFALPRTSSESPLAGAELRLSAGMHELTARDRSGKQTERTVRLIAGQQHLYAPLSEHYCFTLETTRYGRQGVEVSHDPLPKGEDFLLLPTNVDLWLSPAPPSHLTTRWTGGSLTALRQAPCAAGTPQ